MDDWKGLGFAALLAAIVLAMIVLKRLSCRRYPAGALPYFSRRYLLSKGEAAFFHALRSSLPPGVLVAPEVRVSDLIGCDRAARARCRWEPGASRRGCR